MVKPQMMDEIEYNSTILLHEFPLRTKGGWQWTRKQYGETSNDGWDRIQSCYITPWIYTKDKGRLTMNQETIWWNLKWWMRLNIIVVYYSVNFH